MDEEETRAYVSSPTASGCVDFDSVRVLLATIDQLRRVMDQRQKTCLAAIAEERLMHQALRNVRALAMRLRKTDPENAAHFLRFCESAGVVSSVMRSAPEAP